MEDFSVSFFIREFVVYFRFFYFCRIFGGFKVFFVYKRMMMWGV